MTNKMDGAQQALALANTYQLFGELFFRGVTPKTLPYVRSLEPLAASLASFQEPPGQRHLDESSFSPSLAAAEHQRLFGFQLFPFESHFLSESRLVGGPLLESVIETYHKAGYTPANDSESADHLGVELDFLSHLCRQEATADHTAVSQQWQDAQIDALDRHILRWVPLCLHAIILDTHPFYRPLAELVLEVLLDHRRRLQRDTDQSASGNDDKGAFSLPEAPSLLDLPKTGLRDIAAYLLTPAWSGMTLSREEIRHVSHSQQAPAGFGQRQTMLHNVLQSAVEYDQLPDVAALLLARTETWRSFYEDLLANELPTLTAITHTWTQRLEATRALLERIAVESAALAAAIDES